MLRSVKISTISYNTDKFLTMQLDSLVSCRKIRFYMFINHLAEAAELSNHKHLLVVPDERIDTRDLDDIFKEPDPDNILPLDCKDWNVTSNILDWILYAVHDPLYCAEKHKELKQYTYTKEDIHCNDKKILENYYYMAYHEFSFWKNSKFIKLLNNGHTPQDLVKNGYVSMSEMVNFHYFCKNLALDGYTNNTY